MGGMGGTGGNEKGCTNPLTLGGGGMEREAPGLLNIDVANVSLLLEHPGADCEFSLVKESKSGH